MVTEQMAILYTDQEQDKAEQARYTAHYRALLADKTPVPNWPSREADLTHMWAGAIDGVTMRRARKDGALGSLMLRVPLRWEMD